MNILDRFSTHLKEILARAMQVANELKNSSIEPLHLFYAAMNEKGSVAAELVSRFKPDIKIMEQMLLALPMPPQAEKKPEQKISSELQLPPLSPQSKLVLEKALIIAQKNGHNYLGSEHLLAALLEIDDERLKDYFKVTKFKLEEISKEVDSIFANAAQFPNINEVAEAAEQIQDNMLGSAAQPLGPQRKARSKKNETALNYFAVDLTEKKNQEKIDPVIGRENEIERLIQILSRRTKNNPVLLGDPGVGKTAIVEGLAKKIAEGKVPEILRNKKIYAVDLGMLVAGTIYRGEFEARLKELIDDASKDPDVIIFIDEIHNIVGAGSSQGSMDAANLLKPALARGSIHCIGSTTPAEFKKFIESDAALERRLMPILVREPTINEAVKILRGIKKNYEAYHRIKIDEGALRAAVEMSARYISGKFLPDKAIDLLDETSAAKRLSAETNPEEDKLSALRLKLREINSKKEEAALSDRFGEALKMKDEEKSIFDEIQILEHELQNSKEKIFGTVETEDVVAQVAKIIGREPSEIITGNETKFNRISARLKKFVIGQEEPIDNTVALIRQAELGLSDPQRPTASLLYVGPSGVGKTELAKSLAKILYPGQDALIKLDMSEFGESFGASKLLGSPAGYVGYKESNQFTDKLKLQPYSVVLFDEIDKAHPDILKLLLQILEEGEITDATGKKISLKHAIIILTTSFGAEELKKGAFGFNDDSEAVKENKNRLKEKLRDRFTPELVNRLDRICFFRELSASDLAKIAAMEIDSLNGRLKKYSTKITANRKDLEKLVAGLGEKNYNARDIRQKIRSEIENSIAEIILSGVLKKSYSLETSAQNLSLK